MRTPKDDRAAGWAGLASFTLIVVAMLVGPPLWDFPTTTATPEELAEFVFPYRTRILSSFYVYSLAMGFFLWFSAGLWTRLRQSEPEPRILSATFAFGAVVAAALILASFAPGSLSVYRPPAPATAGLLFDLTFGVVALSGIPTAVFLGAYAALIFRGAPLPRGTAWLALLGVATHVAIPASFFPRSGFMSLEGAVIIWVPATFFAWILAVSIALLRVPASND